MGLLQDLLQCFEDWRREHFPNAEERRQRAQAELQARYPGRDIVISGGRLTVGRPKPQPSRPAASPTAGPSIRPVGAASPPTARTVTASRAVHATDYPGDGEDWEAPRQPAPARASGTEVVPARPASPAVSLTPIPTPRAQAEVLQVAQDLQRAQGKGIIGTAIEVRRIEREAATQERIGEQVLRKLDVQTKVAKKAEADVRAKTSLKGAMYDDEIAEERKIAELLRARDERVKADLALQATFNPPEPEPEARPIPNVRVSDRQIQAMATSIVMKVKARESSWPTERQKLHAAFPVNIAREVEAQVNRML